jgi:nucleotide-binding universal stress UspA family protein
MDTVGFPVLVATDGSAHARAAVAAAGAFPWPREARVDGVVVRGLPIGTAEPLPPEVWQALDDALEREAARARTELRRRWATAEVRVIDGAPAEAILRESRRRRARAIVVGCRGHGLVGRLVLGSVSRGVVRHARGAVLVVKARPGRPRRFLVGLDGSRHGRRTVGFLAALAPPPGTRVRLVTVLEPVQPASLALLPASIRATLAAEAQSRHTVESQEAQHRLDRAGRALSAAGWTVDVEPRRGVPLDELLAAVDAFQADLVVAGARGVGAVERLLLGSVAEGLLTHSPVSVLVVR